MNNEYAHFVKWLPENQAVRCALAQSYRKSHRENPALTRLLYHKVKAVKETILTQMGEDMEVTEYVGRWTL